MYQMDRKIHSSRHFKPAHRKGTAAMKTASLTLPMHTAKWNPLHLAARYLPHVVIISLLLGILAMASYGAPTYHQTGHLETHLGQHL